MGNMQSVYDRATCCRSGPPFFFPSSPLFSTPRDMGCGESLQGSTAGSPLVILMYKSSNPNSRPTRSRNFRAILFSLFPASLLLLRLQPAPLSFTPDGSRQPEKASPGILRAFRINKASEARTPKALKHEKAGFAGCFDFSDERKKKKKKGTDASAFQRDVTWPAGWRDSSQEQEIPWKIKGENFPRSSSLTTEPRNDRENKRPSLWLTFGRVEAYKNAISL